MDMDNILKEPPDRRIMNLAAEVSGADDRLVPKLLLKLKEILESFDKEIPHQQEKLLEMKAEIWSYDLLHMLLTALKVDFSKMMEGWKIAGTLSTILSQCCVGLDPTESRDFYGIFLPNVVDTLLVLARKMQMKYMKTSDVLEDTKRDLLGYFTAVLDGLMMLLNSHEFLAIYVMKGARLLQLLISDDANTTVKVMTAVQGANKMKYGLFGELDETVVSSIMDELVYKLSASANAEVAGASTRTVLVISDNYHPTVELLCTRYKGMKPMLSRWEGKGFDRDLKRLILLLDSGSMKQARIEKLHIAARCIQAWWKSYYTRTRLRKADQAFSKFQRSFRVKKQTETRRKEDRKMQAQLQRMLLIHRKKTMRELRQKQLETLEIIPASEVPKHLQNEQTRAALKIQSWYRGGRVRNRMRGKGQEMSQFRAAVKIQRVVRKWLERIESRRKEPPSWQRPPGLTDERRVGLQTTIMEWRDIHQLKAQSKSDQSDLHDKVQDLLRQNAIKSKITRKKEMHREALLARLDMDASLLLNAPTLPEADEPDLEMFACHSVPVATKARHNHQEELRLLQQPWWKKLGDQYQDSRVDDEQQLGWKLF